MLHIASRYLTQVIVSDDLALIARLINVDLYNSGKSLFRELFCSCVGAPVVHIFYELLLLLKYICDLQTP